MIIAAKYSFKEGEDYIRSNFPSELDEVMQIIYEVNSENYKTKVGKEKTNLGELLYDPGDLNDEYERLFNQNGWNSYRISCEYDTKYYEPGYQPGIDVKNSKGAFREMDFTKDRLGVEIQFGKYAFMVYNICAKMTIFHNLDIIDAGIEIVPMRSFVEAMSTGVSYFEQIGWDLDNRGYANIDIPVLILGVDTENYLENTSKDSE